MNTVIIVNLNGNAFHIEEPGYQALQSYLERARFQLRDNPDRDEIMSDLEQAIADKCSHHLRPHKNVVSSVDIEAVLKEMGPVQADCGEASANSGGSGASAGPAPSPATGHGQRRLYQIREGAMISGVCTGLASYFTVDVTLVRILFVVATLLTGGLWILVYGAMMLLVPFANTDEEFAAASGAPFNAQDVIDRAKQHYAQFKDGAELRRHWRQQRRAWRRQWHDGAYWWRHNLQRNVYHFSTHSGYFGQVLAGLMIPVLAIISITIMFVFLTTLVVYATTGSLFGYTLFGGVPLWVGLMLLCLFYGIVASPLQFMRRAVYAHRGAAGEAWYGLFDNLFSLCIVVVAAWFAYQHIPQVHDFFQHFNENVQLIWNNLNSSLHHSAEHGPMPGSSAGSAPGDSSGID